MSALPELTRQAALLFHMHFFAIVRSKRVIVSLLLAAAPPVLGYIVARFEDDAQSLEVISYLGTLLLLQVVTPLVSFIVGSAAVTEEIENRTVTYIFTRPIHRAALFLGRWAATVTLVALLLIGSAAALAIVAGGATGELPPGTVPRLLLAAGFGGAVYSTIAAVLGVFLRRPMIIGLGYAFAMEFLIANIPGSTQALSVQFYLRSIFIDNTHEIWKDGPPFIEGATFQSPTEASVRLALTLVFAAVVGAIGITRKQYVLTS